MDYKLIYKPSTISEAITLTIDVVSACAFLTKDRLLVVYRVDGSPVPLFDVFDVNVGMCVYVCFEIVSTVALAFLWF